jgi:DNA-binding CsgD family transcriptional regulator
MNDRKLPLDLTILLTKKELEVAMLLHKGLSLREIATELHMKYGTARNHLAHILMKTGMNRTELVLAVERSLTPIADEIA